jgi:uncharacterized membrane protein YfcA
VGFLTIGFMGGVWLGAQLANRIPETPLRYGFAGLLAFLALQMAFGRNPEGTATETAPDLATPRIWLPGILIGLAGGLASGLLGIGGAILMNPLLVSRLRLPQHQAQVTSLALMLAPIGLPGVIVYIQARGGLPWVILSGLALGFMAGAYGGAKMATRIKGARLRLVFAGLMAFMAILLLIRG